MLVPVYLKHVYTIQALLHVCMIAWNIEPPPPSQSPVRSPSCHPSIGPVTAKVYQARVDYKYICYDGEGFQ